MRNNNNNTNNPGDKAGGRLIATDFFRYTVKAFLIGVATSAVLGGAVILLAQSAGQDDAPSSNESSEMPATP